MTSTSVFYAGATGQELTDDQKATFAAFRAFMAAAAVIGPKAGIHPVLGGLLTAYVHLAHHHDVHAAAIECIEQAIANLKNPETISFEAKGRG